MPIYEYKCKKGHVFEVMQSFSDDPLTKCEVCGAPVQRVYHPVSVHFKGSGFYNTDYGTKRRAREKEKGVVLQFVGERQHEVRELLVLIRRQVLGRRQQIFRQRQVLRQQGCRGLAVQQLLNLRAVEVGLLITTSAPL